MPGFVNYFYHEGTLPQHTKSFFNEHEILTVHGIIVKNSLILLHKIKYFPQSVPKNICDTFPADIPTVDSDFTTASTWREYYIYSSTSRHFKMSVFYKGPLLAIYAANANVTTLPSLFSINIYKANAKRMLLDQQNNNNTDEWPPFLLHNTPGLRRSQRTLN